MTPNLKAARMEGKAVWAHSIGVTDSEMTENRIRIILIIEQRNKEGIVTLAAFDCIKYAIEYLICSIGKHSVRNLV